jgi:hypothetical protein
MQTKKPPRAAPPPVAPARAHTGWRGDAAMRGGAGRRGALPRARRQRQY